MEITCRKLNKDDYDQYLVNWWRDWNWDPPEREFLPDNGECGIMVCANGRPVCAGFMYVTNSSVAWVDWIISDKHFREKPYRKKCLESCVSELTRLAEMNGYKYVYALIKHTGLKELYKSLNYIEADTYNSEMILKLK